MAALELFRICEVQGTKYPSDGSEKIFEMACGAGTEEYFDYEHFFGSYLQEIDPGQTYAIQKLTGGGCYFSTMHLRFCLKT